MVRKSAVANGRLATPVAPEATTDELSTAQLSEGMANLGARLADMAAGAAASSHQPAGLVPPAQGTRLARLAQLFELDQLDLDLLLVALAPELDQRIHAVYAGLQSNWGGGRPSVGTALSVCQLSTTSAQDRRRLGPGGVLVRSGLVVLGSEESTSLQRLLRVPDRLVSHLLGDDDPDPALVPLLAHAVPVVTDGVVDLAGAISAGLHVCWVQEQPRSSGFALAAAAFGALELPTVAVDLRRAKGGLGLPSVLRAAVLEASLRGGGLVVGPVEPARDGDALADLTYDWCPLVLVGTQPWDPLWSAVVPYVAEATEPPEASRRQVWTEALRAAGRETAALVSIPVHRLTPEQVVLSVASALTQATALGRDIAPADLNRAARAHNAGRMDRIVRRITPRVTFADLVQTPPQRGDLQDLADRVRNADTVYRTWNMSMGRKRHSLTCLFSGAPGTGKTLSAEALAGELGIDLYVIDLSQVVDKYVGETEKNLEQIFSEAESVNGVLFFDEADALFGKRSEVRDSHDRYANIEVAYMLQRMEQFDGIVILATNLQANLDSAFTRRIDVIVRFPKPDAEARRWLWERHLPAALPRGGDVDLDFLAREIELTGGEIRNISLAAAYLAAAAGRDLSMADLVVATAREHQKRGLLVEAGTFGPYAGLLQA